jgi:hypothetical protein
MAVSTSRVELAPAVERFLRIYAEIAQQVAKRKARIGQEQHQVS